MRGDLGAWVERACESMAQPLPLERAQLLQRLVKPLQRAVEMWGAGGGGLRWRDHAFPPTPHTIGLEDEAFDEPAPEVPPPLMARLRPGPARRIAYPAEADGKSREIS